MMRNIREIKYLCFSVFMELRGTGCLSTFYDDNTITHMLMTAEPLDTMVPIICNLVPCSEDILKRMDSVGYKLFLKSVQREQIGQQK